MFLSTDTILLASSEVSKSGGLGRFFLDGGFFMFCILLCSIVALAVSIYKYRELKQERILPKAVKRSFRYDEDSSLMVSCADRNPSLLSRLAKELLKGSHQNRQEMIHQTEGNARREFLKLNSGISLLEVVITIAPLLGLLGTVSGLVSVFSALGDSGDAQPDPAVLAKGIARALNTTIAGLAVAVPVVIAHSYFTKKLETLASNTEEVLNGLISRLTPQA